MGLFDMAKGLVEGGGQILSGNPLGGFSTQGNAILDFLPDDIARMIPGIGDSMAAKDQNAAQIAAADKQMKFQERMANTAYQRAMKDMKRAGLNPMLAFEKGGAATPSGAMPQIQSESKSKLGEFAMNSALAGKGLSVQSQQANTAVAAQESQAVLNASLANKNNIEAQIKAKDVPKANFQEKIFKDLNNMISPLYEKLKNSAKETSDASRARARQIKIDNWKQSGQATQNANKMIKNLHY